MTGISGGGWIAVGAMNLMVKDGQSDRIKALFVHTGMLSHETGRVPESEIHRYENYTGIPVKCMTQNYKLHATDFDNQWEDD